MKLFENTRRSDMCDNEKDLINLKLVVDVNMFNNIITFYFITGESKKFNYSTKEETEKAYNNIVNAMREL